MSNRNIVQTTFDHFGKYLGGSKKAGCWYVAGSDAIIVLNLQKSQYGPKYFINVALWFTGIGEAITPKPSHCHVQTRLETLVPEAVRLQVEALLDLDVGIDDGERQTELWEVLTRQLEPVIEAGKTLEGLGTDTGRHLLSKSLIDGDGQRFLAAQAGEQ